MITPSRKDFLLGKGVVNASSTTDLLASAGAGAGMGRGVCPKRDACWGYMGVGVVIPNGEEAAAEKCTLLNPGTGVTSKSVAPSNETVGSWEPLSLEADGMIADIAYRRQTQSYRLSSRAVANRERSIAWKYAL